MGNVDFSRLSTEETAKQCLLLSAEELAQQAEKLSPEQVYTASTVLHETHLDDWREKLGALVCSLSKTKALEMTGKALDLGQALEVLDQTLQNPDQQWKLLPLLVGLDPTVFSKLLLFLAPSHLKALQKDGLSEPVLHQLNVLAHELSKRIDDSGREIAQMEVEISALNIKEINRSIILAILHQIEHLAAKVREIISKAEKALSIAWHTDRSELIDVLSKIKEAGYRQTTYLGTKRSFADNPTGLFLKFEERLSSVFGSPFDPDNFESLTDEEPAFEALSKLSIWYLKDYWEAGLLPDVPSPSVLDKLDHAPLNNQHLIEERNQYLKSAEHNLTALGISRVKDLKRSMIFTKRMLFDFIQEHKAQSPNRPPV